MTVALIDNGSLEPAAQRNLRTVAAALSERAGVAVEPVSWKHSDRIAVRALMGAATSRVVAAPIKARSDESPRAAWTLAPFVRAQVARGEREFLFMPFFISAQGAIGSALRGDLEKLSNELGGLSFAFTDGLAARGAVAGIVAARVRETLAAKRLSRPAVIVVESRRAVARVRDVARRDRDGGPLAARERDRSARRRLDGWRPRATFRRRAARAQLRSR